MSISPSFLAALTGTPTTLPASLIAQLKDVLTEWPITLDGQKGIDESQESTVLPAGFLVSCKNWIPEPTGSLRARQAWQAGPSGFGKAVLGSISIGANLFVAASGTPFTQGPMQNGGDVGRTLWVPLNNGGQFESVITSIGGGGNNVQLRDNAPSNGTNKTARTQASNDVPQYTQPPTNRKIRGMAYIPGLGIGWTSRAVWIIGLWNDTSNNLEIWATESGLSDSWHFGQALTIPSAAQADAYPVAFAKGNRSVLYVHPFAASGTNPGINQWAMGLPAVPNALVNSPSSARAIAFHKDRFFAGGSDPSYADDVNPSNRWPPYRLYFSNLRVASGWCGPGDTPAAGPNADNFLEIGKDDGEPIEDIVSFQGQLMVGKSSSVWIVSGSDLASFNLTRLEGTNCARGRTLISTPFGLVILGSREAWIWKGGDPQIISTPVEQTYSLNADQWRMGVYAGGYLFVSGFGTGTPMLAFDLQNGVWHTEDVGSDAEQCVSLASHNNRIVGGVRNSPTTAPLVFRDIPFGARTKDTQAADCVFDVRWPDSWLTRTRQKITVKHLWIRYRQRSGTVGDNGLMVSSFIDGTLVRTETIEPRAGTPLVDFHRMDLGKAGKSMGVEFTTTLPAAGGALWDVEEVVADVDVLPAQ